MRRESLGSMVGWAMTLVTAVGPAMAADRQPAKMFPDRPVDKEATKGLLGELFESKGAGIAFRAPANSLEVRKQGIADLIVEFINEDQQMLLRASTLELKEDRKLLEWKDANGRKQKGLISEVVETFGQQNPTSELLRNEVKTINGKDVGLLAFRYSQGTARKFFQEALIPLTDRYYYMLTYTSPGAKSNEGVDEKEKLAADTFAEVLATVKLIDRKAVVQEQEQRLSNTKQLLLALRVPKEMEEKIVPEQWMRLVRDGKDIGYSHIMEEKAKEDGRDGVLVSVRSRTMAAPDQQVDVSSRMFISKEWKHEAWSHVVDTTVKGKDEQSAELGLSDQEIHYEVEKQPDLLSQAPTEENKKKQPEIRELLRYKLQVRTKMGPTIARPQEFTLPAWYLPQAIKHLLPRMLPLDKKQGYMFVAYVSELHQAMLRYVDVGAEREVDFDGRMLKVIPIQDRVGFEGVPTTYFVTRDGKYMGSETVYKMDGKDSVIRVYPTDEPTLRKLWKDVQGQKPQASDVPQLPAGKK